MELIFLLSKIVVTIKDMFLYIIGTRKITVQSTQDVMDLFRSDSSLEYILTDFHKVLKIILTVPVSSFTAETSFPALRR